MSEPNFARTHRLLLFDSFLLHAMSDPGHDSTNTPTPHNSPYTQSVELPDSDRHVVDGMPITIQLTALLDDNVIRNWLVTYNLYVLQYGKSNVFRNTIISDWR